MSSRYDVFLTSAVLIAMAAWAGGCGGDRCAHDACEPDSKLDSTVTLPDVPAGVDARDVSGDVAVPDSVGVDAARDAAVDDAPAGDAAADVVTDVATDVASNPYGLACRTCYADDECGQGSNCTPVGAGKYCLNECDDDGDCARGFVCYQGSQSQDYCLPVSFNCVACIADEPCPQGECCDFNSGACKHCGRDCSVCSYDYDCGPGYRCFKNYGAQTGMCVPECVDGVCQDSVHFTCEKTADGVELCEPLQDGCLGCSGATPYPLDDGCVECRDSWDCPDDDICLELGHTCAHADCVNENERPCKHDGQCHECCDDRDCMPESSITGVCLPDGTCEIVVQCGGLCTSDFPVCAVIDGVEQCVQCLTDKDCLALGYGSDCTCGGAPNYVCFEPYGSMCGSEGHCTAACADSDDCPPGPDDTTLNCVQQPGAASGICVNTSGHCDGGITNCCGAGQRCYDLVMILQDLVPTIPRIIAPPAVTATYCGCDTAEDCLAGGPCTEMSILCTSGDYQVQGMYELICPDGQLNQAFPDKICIQPATLLENFGLVPAT